MKRASYAALAVTTGLLASLAVASRGAAVALAAPPAKPAAQVADPPTVGSLSTMIENLNNDNLKNVVHKVKFTKNPSTTSF